MLLGGGAQAYQIEQSLRFDGSSYLRLPAPGSGSPSDTHTFSWWYKKPWQENANPGVVLWNRGGSGYAQTAYYIDGVARWTYASLPAYYSNQGSLRDVSAWYHFMITRSGNTIKMYQNGVELTPLNTSPYPSSQASAAFGNYQVWIGCLTDSSGNPSSFFQGYMAEVHAVNGSALDPTDFGEFDGNGVWRPIKVTGLTYGTNGFYLKFDPSATNGIGHDHSGNGNNFTASGFTTSGTGTDVMSDTPTTNWCTLNPLSTTAGTYSEGNLTYYSASGWRRTHGTIGVSSGKWYYEFTLTSSPYSPRSVSSRWAGFGFGLFRFDESTSYDREAITLFDNGYRANWSTGSPTYTDVNSASFSTGDILSIAVDIDAGTYQFKKNNTSVDSGSIGAASGAILFPHVLHDTSAYSNYVVNFGQRAFAYTPPTGYKALNTANLPAPDIADGSEYFNTVLYTGNSSTQSITGVGFQPDWVWAKSRSEGYSHYLYDVVRGAGTYINTNNTDVEYNNTSTLSSFNTDGFSLGSAPGTNNNAQPYVAWNWLAGGSGSSNTAGSITSTVSANPSAGFSIVTYTGTGSAATVGHGLGVAPSMVFTKYRNAVGYDWYVYHKSVTSGKYLRLNTTEAQIGPDTTLYSSAPSSTVINYGSSVGVMANGGTYVAYCFAEVEGFSKISSYVGNGSNNGVFVWCGFKPAFLLGKASSTTSQWFIWDAERNTYNPLGDILYPNLSSAEGASALDVDFTSNGFKFREGGGAGNDSNVTYVFIAFASSPFGGDGVSPATAR